ncbi:MAG: WD40/YVTN/BNR-like repeat-containing protein [Actinomycetota bacterium]
MVNPVNPTRLFVGGHHGVASSTNGGKTWRPVDTLEGADAMGWAFSGERVLVGGHPGLFVSEDGGRSFERRNEGLPATDIHALGAADGVIYAASPQLGVFASLDGGRTWEVRTQEVGHSFMGGILVDPEDSDHVVAPDMSAGAVESTDGGRTWRALGGAPGAMWVSWEPEDTRHIVVSAMDQAAVTTDGGATWQPIDVPDGASLVEMSPDNPRTLYAAVHEGDAAVVWVSRDGGGTWTRS